MSVRYFSLIIGVIYIALGVMGFIPALVEPTQTAPELMARIGVTQGFGYLLGLFPANIVYNIFHLVVGVFGIVAFLLGEQLARLYSDVLAVWLGLLGILGLVPFANTVFGLMPAFGNNVWLHLVTAIIAAYFGFYLDSGYLVQDPQEAEKFKEIASK